ncbi:ankyrin repeat-containing protein [Tanacetum coccineum]
MVDANIKAMKEESDAKLDAKSEELRQLILGSAPSQSTHVDHVPQITKVPLFDGEDAYGWIYRVERYFEIQELPQQEQLRAAALCMEGEALSWYRWSEGRTPFHSWDGFKRRLLIRFQQSQEGNLYEQFLAITQEESARAYVALFEKLACQLVGISESVMEATFIKGLKPALRATVRVMNPEGLNHAMELAVSIEDNELYEGVMQSKGVAAIVGQTTSKGDNFRRMTESEIKDRRAKGLCFRCEEKYTPGHRCASSTLQVLLVDESDEAEERDLNFKSWNREAKASMDALEKKIDDGIGKLDASIKAMKEEKSDSNFEDSAQLNLVYCSHHNHTCKTQQQTSKGKLDHMNDDRNRQRTSFGSEFEATGFEQPTGFRQQNIADKNNYEQQLYVWKARLYLGIDGVRDELHSIRGMALKGACVRRNTHPVIGARVAICKYLVDESDEAEERDLNFKSRNGRGSK